MTSDLQITYCKYIPEVFKGPGILLFATTLEGAWPGACDWKWEQSLETTKDQVPDEVRTWLLEHNDEPELTVPPWVLLGTRALWKDGGERVERYISPKRHCPTLALEILAELSRAPCDAHHVAAAAELKDHDIKEPNAVALLAKTIFMHCKALACAIDENITNENWNSVDCSFTAKDIGTEKWTREGLFTWDYHLGQVLAGIGDEGKRFAEQLRTKGASRLKRANEIKSVQLVWTNWVDPVAPPLYTPFLSSLAACLWKDKVKLEWDKRIGMASWRELLAVDCENDHYQMLAGWDSRTKEKRIQKLDDDHRLSFALPGRPIQLSLDLPNSIPEYVIQEIKDCLGPEALRDWAALQIMLTRQGRTGTMRWSIDEHMELLGYARKARNNQKIRKRHAQRVEMFTLAQLVLHDKNGKERDRYPIFHVDRKTDKKISDSEWTLDGMLFRINPSLYKGVRNFDTDQLGTKWFPGTAKLAQVNHQKYPHVGVLGILLGMHWRWHIKSGYVDLSGRSLLNMAGIPFKNRYAYIAWDKLERSLTELQRISGIGEFRWKDEDTKRTLEGVMRLHPAEEAWVIMSGQIRLDEPTHAQKMLTGKDLAAWRKEKSFTQENAASALGVGRRTIIRAEKQPEKKLTSKLQRAISTHINMTGPS